MPTPPGPGRSSIRMRSGRNVAAIAACASSQSDVRAAGDPPNGSAAMLAFCRRAAVILRHPPTTSQVKPTTSQVTRCVSAQGSGPSADTGPAPAAADGIRQDPAGADPHPCPEPGADELLGRDPLALVIGMLLDQHMRQRSSAIRAEGT